MNYISNVALIAKYVNAKYVFTFRFAQLDDQLEIW